VRIRQTVGAEEKLHVAHKKLQRNRTATGHSLRSYVIVCKYS